MGGGVHIIEQNRRGQIFVNVDCVLARALFRTSDYYEDAKSNSIKGLMIRPVILAWAAKQKNKDYLTRRFR
jgi:pyruvate/2-oxoglutarate dehydrogenase complex dihydrolipoamide dehydrogenase (E3) component